MITTFETHSNYIPFSSLSLSNSAYAFRLGDPERIEILSTGLRRSGQAQPIYLEESEAGELLVLDGHLRCDAIQSIREKKGPWEKVLAQVFAPKQLSTIDKFRLIRDKNFFGETAFGLIEMGRFFNEFKIQGLSIQQMAEETHQPAHTIEDFIELAGTPIELQRSLNQTPIDPALALMFLRHYSGWAQGPHNAQALKVAETILAHAKVEKVSMKSWRFLINFYWPSDRPFMLQKLQHQQ